MDQTPHDHTGKSSRELAYLHYAHYLKDGTFLPEASAISFGACKMARLLDEVARLATPSKKLNLKTKEKALLRCALFEFYFMDNSPRYAVGQEMVELAKKYCHSAFSNFLNALLRNLPEKLPEFSSFGITYSYPDELVSELFTLYSKEEVKKILEIGNLPAKTMARKRPGFEMIDLDPSEVAASTSVKELYIMNKTPAKLISTLASNIPPPDTILDLCASPGGKLLALHDIFPEAQLFANDVSGQKLSRLQENCEKYEMAVELREGSGESYPEENLFDLVVLDVPCSNTGVFAKHPEARWRQSELELLQKTLLEKAKKLVKPSGHIFYMTCSVLKREIPEGSKIFEIQILPTEQGQDGGYGAILKI